MGARAVRWVHIDALKAAWRSWHGEEVTDRFQIPLLGRGTR